MALLFSLLLVVGGHALAENVPSSQPQILEEAYGSAFIGPPPLPDSVEAKEDMAVVLWIQRIRTKKQVGFAKYANDLSVETFAPIISKDLFKVDAAALKNLLEDAAQNVKASYFALKDRYKRLRPYEANSDVHAVVKLGDSFSYPSGHATRAMFIAKLLSEVFPGREKELNAYAYRIAYSRVFAGVHFPSDVLAGLKLGEAYAIAVQNLPDYAKRLKDLKAPPPPSGE